MLAYLSIPRTVASRGVRRGDTILSTPIAAVGWFHSTYTVNANQFSSLQLISLTSFDGPVFSQLMTTTLTTFWVFCVWSLNYWRSSCLLLFCDLSTARAFMFVCSSWQTNSGHDKRKLYIAQAPKVKPCFHRHSSFTSITECIKVEEYTSGHLETIHFQACLSKEMLYNHFVVGRWWWKPHYKCAWRVWRNE